VGFEPTNSWETGSPIIWS